MKSIFFIISLIFTAALFSFRTLPQGVLVGKLTPMEAVQSIWAINGTDTVKVAPEGNSFRLSLKPGDYKLIVDANDKYQNVIIDKIKVTPARISNLGEIALKPALK